MRLRRCWRTNWGISNAAISGKRLAILGVTFLVGFAILGVLLGVPWFYAGLGVSEPSAYMALTLFVLVAPAFTFFLQPLFSSMSRKHEFEADDFAKAQVRSGSLINALVKLYKEKCQYLDSGPVVFGLSRFTPAGAHKGRPLVRRVRD